MYFNTYGKVTINIIIVTIQLNNDQSNVCSSLSTYFISFHVKRKNILTFLHLSKKNCIYVYSSKIKKYFCLTFSKLLVASFKREDATIVSTEKVLSLLFFWHVKVFISLMPVSYNHNAKPIKLKVWSVGVALLRLLWLGDFRERKWFKASFKDKTKFLFVFCFVV